MENANSIKNMENLFERVEDKEVEKKEFKRYSFFRRFLRELISNKMALISLILLIIIIIASILAPLSPYNPNEIDVMSKLQRPSADHIFGTDEYGRDVLTRALYGGRVSLIVGFMTMIFSVIIGVTVGIISGYFGGIVDTILMRITDIFLAVPSTLVMIVLNTLLNPGLGTLILVLSLFSWASIARITRAETMSLRERDFILATKNLGASNLRVSIAHILPNIIGPVTVAASLSVANAILSESALSFLGLGVQPPQASWGSMLQEAQKHVLDAGYLAIFPGVLIFITVLSFNLLGDVLRSSFEAEE